MRTSFGRPFGEGQVDSRDPDHGHENAHNHPGQLRCTDPEGHDAPDTQPDDITVPAQNWLVLLSSGEASCQSSFVLNGECPEWWWYVVQKFWSRRTTDFMLLCACSRTCTRV